MKSISFPPPSDSLYSRTVNALLWQGGGQVAERLARLMASVVLTRLLFPEDFGLAGAVTAALAAIDSLMFIGSNQVIQQSDRGRRPEFLDTVFAVAVIRGLAIGLLLLALAPLIARYFASTQALPMFALLAIQPVLSGLANPRSQVLVKDLQFKAWSICQVASNGLGLLVMLLLAVWLRNAWALVLGQILTQLFVSVGSYLIAPYRPRWRFDSETWRELRAFGLRASGTPLILMLVAHAPVILLARIQGMAALGVFLLNQRLAVMPQSLFSKAISTVALPAYSTIKSDPDRLAAVWLRALRLIGLLVLPVSAVLMWIDSAFPAILYGAHFAGARGLFSLLVVDGVLSSVGVVTEPLFWALGLPSYDRNIQFIRLVVLYAVAAPFLFRDPGLGLAAAFAVSAILSQVLMLIYARRLVAVPWISILHALIPGGLLAAAGLGILAGLSFAVPLANVETLAAGGTILALSMAAAVLHLRRTTETGTVRLFAPEPLPHERSDVA